jgi:putative peptidoglycan lipid II flippase
LGIIFGAVALSAFFTPGVIGMSWGALIGATLGNLVIPYLAMRRLQSKFHFSLDLSHPGVKKVFKLMLPVVLGLSLPGVYGLILQWFGSFDAEGVNTALKYSNQLMLAPVGIFGQSLAIAVFPALSQFYAQGNMEAYKQSLASTMRQVIYITLPITAVILALSPQIVAAVYQHGKFTASDTALVADMLVLFGIGIFAWCLHPVLMRAFFALQNTWLPILIGTGTTALFIAIVFALRASNLGHAALPLASSISAIALVIALAIAIRARIGAFGAMGVLSTLIKSAIPSGLLGLALYGISVAASVQIQNLGKLGAVATVGLGAILVGWAYYGITKLMGMPETKYVQRAMRKVDAGQTDGSDA